MKQTGRKFEVVPLSEVPRENVRREDVARENATADGEPSLQPKKSEPYAIKVNTSVKADSAWSAYCKNCELRFTPKQQPSQLALDETRGVWLRCPYCGHANEYTLTDLLHAMESSLGVISKSIQ